VGGADRRRAAEEEKAWRPETTKIVLILKRNCTRFSFIVGLSLRKFSSERGSTVNSIHIIGAAIRAHLHLQPGDRMPPIITITTPINAYSCLGAHIAGPARVCYDPSAPLSQEAWIESIWPVLHYDYPIVPPPRKDATLVHLNSNHQRANRYAQRNHTGAEEKQVLLVRQPAGVYERGWRVVQTTGPAWVVVASKETGVDPQPCGAWVWLQTYHPVVIDCIVETQHELAAPALVAV